LTSSEDFFLNSPRPLADMLRDREISVTKLGGYMLMPDEMAMDEGLITDTRPPVARHAPGYPLRWRIREAVTSARLRLGRWIAGVELADEEDW
jgi:hypothetical protein